MARRYNRARLITRDDPRYQAYLEQFRIARSYQRAMRPPGPRQLFGQEVETLLREWLGTSRTLSERRYLEYEERVGRRWVLKYRELDAVEIPDAHTVHVFEIKASKLAKSLDAGLRQLRQDREILSRLFARIAVTLLFVDTGMAEEEQQAVLAGEPDVVVLEDLSTLAGYGGQVGLHWVPLERVIELAGGEEHLTLEWMREEEALPAGPVAKEPTRVYTSGEPGEIGALGQALLEALRRQGGRA